MNDNQSNYQPNNKKIEDGTTIIDYKKICQVCGDEIPIGISLSKICPKCLIKPIQKK